MPDPGSPSAAKPAEPMLRDEALDWLAHRVESDASARLLVQVDHGLYRASYERHAIDAFEGDWYPNLTDALCALIGLLP